MPPRVKVKKLAVIVGLGTALGVWRARMLAINERERYASNGRRPQK
jgi:hypothetical protein